MSIKILMPALSPTMTEGNLVKWHKKAGDKVKSGDLLAEIETDKATMEVEAVDEGIIGKLVVEEGAQGIAVNAVIAVLLEKGEDKSVLDGMDFGAPNKVAVVATPKETKAEPITIKENPKTQPIISSKERIFASPLAKRIADEQRINLHNVSGTGPHGRIIKADVLASSGSTVSAHEGPVVRVEQEYKTIVNSSIRKVIARRLSESKQNVPHSYLSIDCNVDKLLELRHDINHARSSDTSAIRVSVNDMIIKAVALTLKQVPEANSAWTDEAILQYNNVDVSVAVSIDGGLITPIVFNADQKSIFTISKEVKELAVKARAGTLKPHEFQGGGFSVSNLGMYGIKQFNAIINPPQSCILAVGANILTPVAKDNKIEIANIMCVTLSSDHRSLDGAMSAKFLQAFKEVIENPIRLLLGY